MTDLRVGIAGAGMIAGVHARAYAAEPGVRVVAVADPVASKAERLASQVGAATLPDLEALIEADLDILSVCTPSPTHAGLTVQALQAGLNVLCEKPIARSLDDASSIVRASEPAAGICMIGHVSRFEPDHRQAQQVVESGQLGELQMMSHSITTSLPGWSEVGWLANLDLSGGPVVDLAVHSFDYLSWVSGSQPIRLHAVGADTAVGPSTYAVAHVRYSSGAIGLVETSWAHPASHGFQVAVELIGTEGRLSWSYDSIAGGWLHRRDGASVRFDPLGEQGFSSEIHSFVEAVRSGGPPPVPPADGLSALRTSLATLESVRSGATIDLTSWEQP
ncbi:MAG: Gfo/Idh/MocA family protein [Nocardioidaceae bacterium]